MIFNHCSLRYAWLCVLWLSKGGVTYFYGAWESRVMAHVDVPFSFSLLSPPPQLYFQMSVWPLSGSCKYNEIAAIYWLHLLTDLSLRDTDQL